MTFKCLEIRIAILITNIKFDMSQSDPYGEVAKNLESILLRSQSNTAVIPMEEFYSLTGRERLTNKFYAGVSQAGGERHLLIAFGENIVAITRDVKP